MWENFLFSYIFLQLIIFSDTPVCKEKEKLIFVSSKHEPVMFPCKMDANPVSDLHFKWTFNNSENFLKIQVELTGPSQK